MESQNSETPQSGSQQQGMNSQNSESQPSESQQQEGKPQNNGESSSEGQQDNKKSQNKEKPKKEHQEERKTQNKSTDNKTAKPSPERQFEETPEQKAAIKENQKKAQDMFRDLSSSRPQGSNHNNNWDGTFDDFGQEEVPQSVINKLVENFFDQVFSKKSDLNQKRNSAKQNPRGAVEWNTTAIITDKLTGNYMKMPRDKIGRKKESGDGTDIPLSFYFDLSGSMDMHIRFLSIMAYAMLKKGVKIIVGFNEFAYFQINEIPQNFKQDNFGEFMSEIQTMINNSMSMFFDDWDPDQDQNENLSRGSKKKNDKISRQIKKKTKVDITPLNGIKIDKYLIGNNAEKTVVFSDFDPRAEVVQLSKKCEVFWFCFEMNPCSVSDLSDFSGKFYKTTSEEDICKHLKNIKSISYEREQRRAATFGYCNPNNYGSPSNPSNSMGNSSQNPWEQGYQYNSGPNYNGYNPSDRFGW